MLLYSIVMFVGCALLAVFSLLIYRGKTDLIHSYHQTRVQNKAEYGKAIGKALSVFSASCLISGVIGLFADSKAIGMAAVLVLIGGFVLGVIRLAAVQMKYNRGIF